MHIDTLYIHRKQCGPKELQNQVPALTRNSSTSKGELDMNDFDIFCFSLNVTILI